MDYGIKKGSLRNPVELEEKVVFGGEINPGDRLLAKRQGKPRSNMISQKGTWFIPEILTQFPKASVKRMKMEIYLGLRRCGVKLKYKWGVG